MTAVSDFTFSSSVYIDWFSWEYKDTN